MSFTFAVDSDLHFVPIRKEKQFNADRIIDAKPDFLIVSGDLTERGTDGESPCCFIKSGKDNLTPFIEEYYNKITENHIPIYLCPGNHDNWVPWPYIYKPVIDFIEKKKGLRYSFNHKGLHFVCCGIYPDSDTLEWLKKDLKNVSSPIVLFFHYNINGPYSTWWARDKDEDEEIKIERQVAFYEVIKDKDVKMILTGHWHANNISNFEPKKGVKIPTIVTGGKGFALCTWNGRNIEVRFVE